MRCYTSFENQNLGIEKFSWDRLHLGGRVLEILYLDVETEP